MSLTTYIQETRRELSHVNWPTRRQAIAFTAIVIVFSIAISFFLAFFDLIFGFIIRTFVF